MWLDHGIWAVGWPLGLGLYLGDPPSSSLLYLSGHHELALLLGFDNQNRLLNLGLAGLKRTLFSIHPLLVGYGTRNWVWDDEQIKIESVGTWFVVFGAWMDIYLFVHCWKWVFSLFGELCWPLCLEFMVHKFRTRSPMSFTHVSFWCPFWDSHSTIHHSDVGVRLRSWT